MGTYGDDVSQGWLGVELMLVGTVGDGDYCSSPCNPICVISALRECTSPASVQWAHMQLSTMYLFSIHILEIGFCSQLL
jgi:hypothetical protein